MNRSLEDRVFERTQALAAANDQLAELAVTDGLTGLYNYRHFHERLVLEVERCGRNGMPLTFLMIDVDHFKAYNDDFGHPCGDDVLRRMAKVLRDGRRANDLVGRIGGEEFGVVLVETSKVAATAVAERIRQMVLDLPPPSVPDQAAMARPITVSIGLASVPDDAATARGVVEAADKALYVAKHGGRNRVAVFGG
ncbi:MAG: GGDEF domain-containing protein [Myxococcales bacterium]|nr:GGDEF domain-containing protein [Myxococcales bacterium]